MKSLSESNTNMIQSARRTMSVNNNSKRSVARSQLWVRPIHPQAFLCSYRRCGCARFRFIGHISWQKHQHKGPPPPRLLPTNQSVSACGGSGGSSESWSSRSRDTEKDEHLRTTDITSLRVLTCPCVRLAKDGRTQVHRCVSDTSPV